MTYVEETNFVIDLEYWRKVTPHQSTQAILDQAEEGKTPSSRWAALEWLSECNFSNCGRTESEHRYFATTTEDLAWKLWKNRLQLRNIPKNYVCLLLAIEENASDYLVEHPIKNSFLSWRER